MNARKILRRALIATAAVTSLNTYADIHRYQYEGGSLIGPKIFYEETQQNFNYGAFKLFAEFDDSLTSGINLLSHAPVWHQSHID